jgi:uncharacterized protein (DUF924 family)
VPNGKHPERSAKVIDNVLGFWFGDSSEAAYGRWYTRDAAFDAEIRERFGALHDEAARGGLDDWRGTARGELALVVVLDQFSRNLYRDDPRAFAQDFRALDVARALVTSGRLQELTPVEHMVALMPYMHAEDRETQRESVRLFGELAAERPGDGMLANALDYAQRHAVIVERFGRYPHRNAALGRASSPEELTFLDGPNSRF